MNGHAVPFLDPVALLAALVGWFAVITALVAAANVVERLVRAALRRRAVPSPLAP
jgi:hypothetical protein